MTAAFVVGDWIHAHERDHGAWRVFIGASEPLPPSRGRRKLSLHSDGTYLEGQPGMDDRGVQTGGTYRFDGRVLVLQRPGNVPPLTYEVAFKGKCLELKVV